MQPGYQYRFEADLPWAKRLLTHVLLRPLRPFSQSRIHPLLHGILFGFLLSFASKVCWSLSLKTMVVHLRSGKQIRSTDWKTWNEESIRAMSTVLASFSQVADIRIPAIGISELGQKESYCLLRGQEIEFIELDAAEVQCIDQEMEKRKASLASLKPQPSVDEPELE